MTSLFGEQLESRELDAALLRIFSSAHRGRQFLELPADDDESITGGDMAERMARLESTLVRYVVQLAAELDELGEEEQIRIEAEARATLVALRELRRVLR